MSAREMMVFTGVSPPSCSPLAGGREERPPTVFESDEESNSSNEVSHTRGIGSGGEYCLSYQRMCRNSHGWVERQDRMMLDHAAYLGHSYLGYQLVNYPANLLTVCPACKLASFPGLHTAFKFLHHRKCKS